MTNPSEAHIDVEGLTLFFPLYHGDRRSLKKTVFAAATGPLGRDAQHRPSVQALHNISFRLRRGDRLGLVGANGAFRVQGSINALLSVQLGMNPRTSERRSRTTMTR